MLNMQNRNFILVLLLTNSYIIIQTNSYEPNFVTPCTQGRKGNHQVLSGTALNSISMPVIM